MEVNCEGEKHWYLVGSYYNHVNYSNLAQNGRCICGKKRIVEAKCECGSITKKIVDVKPGEADAARNMDVS